MNVETRPVQILGKLQLRQCQGVPPLLEVNQSEPVLEFGVFGPTPYCGVTDRLRLPKAAFLKITQQ